MDLTESTCFREFEGLQLWAVGSWAKGFGSYRVRKIFSGYVKNFPLYVFIERADLTHTLVHQALDRDAAMHSTSHDVFNAHTCECHRHGFLMSRHDVTYKVLRNIMCIMSWQCQTWCLECWECRVMHDMLLHIMSHMMHTVCDMSLTCRKLCVHTVCTH